MINDIKKEIEADEDAVATKEMVRHSVDEQDFEDRHLERAEATETEVKRQKVEGRLFL